MIKKPCRYIILLLLFCVNINYAQTSVNSSGKTIKNESGSVSYSVGQVAYQPITQGNGSVSPGVQQPYEISEITGIPIYESVQVSMYPNPTSDYLYIEIPEDLENKKLGYELYSSKGDLLQKDEDLSQKSELHLGTYIEGTYFLKITENQQFVKTFKIVKN